ncbi:hypothetical protein SAZ10_32745 [Mesorhizobium sp. BAC0120]|uniref:hypothetical protein n=1 Tax=Mesorhizobium sp. BAC0120 TaxID=3090670 RepID=UPI00298BDA16|nr:hypothetical protein [Mesorhizobium sp. BAC0120]MDW6026539.1 hypothetical protein [Mesorhizobium sp. BAC0120]
MLTRTRRFIAHFSAPFRLAGVEGLQPAGAYALDQKEELFPGHFRVAYRRVGMFMHLPATSAGHWTIHLVPVEASEIESAILQDLEQRDDIDGTHGR